MGNISVLMSDSINQIDKIKEGGVYKDISIFDTNNSGKDQILLYMYILPAFPQHGIKVGMAKCRISESYWHAIKSRIADQKHEVALPSEKYEKYGMQREVIFWGLCLDAKSDVFKDYKVHKEIIQKFPGWYEKEQEWFINLLPEELIEVFNDCRSFEKVKEIYEPRKEQKACITALKTYFAANPKGKRFLLNCKMRFGKSYTTYKYCEEENLNRILILTFIPAVESSWKDDLDHIEKEYKYITDKDLRNPDFNLTALDKPYVVFLSLQNYLGKDRNSKGVKDKIAKLQKVNFDIVILDEYHFGAWNSRTQETFDKTMEDLDKDYQKNLKNCKDVIKEFSIKTDKTICLSGTPFKALARGEFNKTNTFTYSYFDEQRNKYPNEQDMTVVDPQYAQFPDMKIFGYNMERLFGNWTANIFSTDKILNRKYFSLNKFFETKADYNQDGDEFIYEDEIKDWLEIIKGKSTHGQNFPYSNIDMLNNNKHSLWLMPTVSACIAMTQLLKNDEYFKKYQIINLSDRNVPSGKDALDYLNMNMNESVNTNKLGSIAITVNKLTTGVTVKEWFSVFVLKDLASPEQYFQSIFRIQTPYKKEDRILKKSGFVYDFNIDRASALLLKYADEMCKDDVTITRMKIASLIVKYLPIFVNGDMQHPISEQVFYELAQFGDNSNIPLSKKITNLDNTTRAMDEEIIGAMLNDPKVSDIIKHVFAHAKFGKPKTRTMPQKPDDGFDSVIAKNARDKAYQLGLADSKDYTFLDDHDTQELFENRIKEYLKQSVPSEYNNNQKNIYSNGFIKGYEQGVNVPIQKLYCGSENGKKFVETIKEQLGENIHYTKETRAKIENIARPYLNDINNIPQEYRGMLYKRWYCDSFLKAIKKELAVPIPDDGNNCVEDANNVLKHILSRLFEFLYISVYRETTFNEIFKNADPNVFLAAVGITKEDFEVLNKYHVFQEDVLNNYIREFFENESLGERIDLSNQKNKDQYRNSFDWFGYGVVPKQKNG